MITTHNLGFPRIGAHRELKKALERYWSEDLPQSALLEEGRRLRHQHWQLQQEAGLNLIPTGDFAWYDQMLNHSLMLGAVPQRFGIADPADIDTLFRMARGRAPSGQPAAACEMTKWFDTNYHYIVPELTKGQQFQLANTAVIDETAEALAQGFKVKPVLIGPLTWLWLSKVKGEEFDRLELLDGVVEVYGQVLTRLGEMLAENQLEWVQMDEPILTLDLPHAWQQAFESVYHRLHSCPVKILLASYFGELNGTTTTVVNLPVDGIHIDLIRAPNLLPALLDRLPAYKVLSAGVVNGRNVWRCDLQSTLNQLREAEERLGDRLWIAPSCSLLHVPVDLDNETTLDPQLQSWFAFARQKCREVAVIGRALTGGQQAKEAAVSDLIEQSERAVADRQRSERVHNLRVQQRVAGLSADPDIDQRHSPYTVRAELQHTKLQQPQFPTTTIGSFPQTAEIRQKRLQFRNGQLDESSYIAAMQDEIRATIKRQEALGLDVLVHGEAERNDMVEYFGQQLDGFAFTSNGWVQSYGSRCVKPPIIIGDINRPAPMTVSWSRFAQEQTSQPVKGMLTGPVTILCWSFPREDVSRETSCLQLALALRDEVLDLEQAGIGIIQIDEPAIREGLPLRQADWPAYLEWAVKSFRIAASGVKDETQIHTHMCYSEFNDIIKYIAAMDADVITIETSRSDMELLDAFEAFEYPNEIGPGVYDIHSPNVPSIEWIETLMTRAAEKIPRQRLWVNPDCGLKTREWPEVEAALGNMVAAARALRIRVQG